MGLAIAPLVAVDRWAPPGLLFWVAIVALGSSSSVRMPGGTLVDVGIAPLLACAVLGGPTAAIVAAAIGTFELRESSRSDPAERGGVPWYGTAYNHAALSDPVGPGEPRVRLHRRAIVPCRPPTLSLRVLVAGGVHYAANNVLTAGAVAIREDGRSLPCLSPTSDSLASVWLGSCLSRG